MYITALFSVTVPTLVGKAFFMNFQITYFGGNDLWQIITYVYPCVIFCHSAYFGGKGIFYEFSYCLLWWEWFVTNYNLWISLRYFLSQCLLWWEWSVTNYNKCTVCISEIDPFYLYKKGSISLIHTVHTAFSQLVWKLVENLN